MGPKEAFVATFRDENILYFPIFDFKAIKTDCNMCKHDHRVRSSTKIIMMTEQYGVIA